jgi:hypothetical protein
MTPRHSPKMADCWRTAREGTAAVDIFAGEAIRLARPVNFAALIPFVAQSWIG